VLLPPLLLLVGVVLLRRPGDGERELSDEGRDFGRDVLAVAAEDDDEGGEVDAAKTSSKGRMDVRCASASAARSELCAGGGWGCDVVTLREFGASHSEGQRRRGWSDLFTPSRNHNPTRDPYLTSHNNLILSDRGPPYSGPP
jgi:hypothetical protein